MSPTDYVDCDALDLAELVRSGQASPAVLLDQALARTAAVNPQINAVIHLMEARARDAIAAGLPDGPFRGVPFLIKDLMTAYAGEPMRCGSRMRASPPTAPTSSIAANSASWSWSTSFSSSSPPVSPS